MEWAELYGIDDNDKGDGLTIYDDELWRKELSIGVYCDKCKESFLEEELIDSYIGDLCKKCYSTVSVRTQILQGGKRSSCPVSSEKYIFAKGRCNIPNKS
ncbi:MAG: hypothetical protein ABIF18_01250 [archaeon]